MRRHIEKLRDLPGVISLFRVRIKAHGGIRGALKGALALYQTQGVTGIKHVLLKQLSDYRNHDLAKKISAKLSKIETAAEQVFKPRILIIAELSIAQCKKYRVTQKQQMFEYLGVECAVVRWNDTQLCMDALSTHSLVIFYRVPGFQNVIDIIEEAKRLNIHTIWEVDDLIFDREILAASKTLAELDEDTLAGLLNGACLYRDAMLACDSGIASTEGLAAEMRRAGLSDVKVIENALDQQTLLGAEELHTKVTESEELVRIVYGSGTNTHNVDFAEAADAILEVMRCFPNVRFRLIGLLDLPPGFEGFESRIERIPYCEYNEYLCRLAECDINIAPLENYIFNEAKSNIKFLEAAVVNVPSVCSPMSAFKSAIKDGVSGFLCDSTQEWISALTLLINSPALRKSIAARAHESIIERYSPRKIAERQLAPVLARFGRVSSAKRILSVNIYYSPRSFGGSTIVAEEINKCLNGMDEFEVFVFTALTPGQAGDYSVRRYEADGLSIFGIALPESQTPKNDFENPEVANVFADIMALVDPDIVHFHCLQGLGVSLADYCLDNRIPYYITLHDAWWLCGRQFMIDRSGQYCHQEEIDLDICSKCVQDPVLNRYRQKKLREVLENASMLLSPSQFFRDFYCKNGFAAEKVMVNKNGIKKPGEQNRRRIEGPVRFGYVGGNTRIKGFHLVRSVFEEIDANAKLLVVDNALNLGYSSFPDIPSEVGAKIEVVPAYTQATIDEYFFGIDVLLFPTQWKESFGLTVREALARNVWVIATDAGGVTEDIVDGVNGTIIPFDDKGERLRQAIMEAIRRYENIEPGRKIVLENRGITYFEDQANELAGIFMK